VQQSHFDLEGAIAQWRERLSWRDAFTNADLDEIESHLRDGVESLVASNTKEQDAFYQTVRTFDEDMKLAWRFNQANWEKVMIKRTRYAPYSSATISRLPFETCSNTKSIQPSISLGLP
jgi:hypothetical protein